MPHTHAYPVPEVYICSPQPKYTNIDDCFLAYVDQISKNALGRSREKNKQRNKNVREVRKYPWCDTSHGSGQSIIPFSTTTLQTSQIMAASRPLLPSARTSHLALDNHAHVVRVDVDIDQRAVEISRNRHLEDNTPRTPSRYPPARSPLSTVFGVRLASLFETELQFPLVALAYYPLSFSLARPRNSFVLGSSGGFATAGKRGRTSQRKQPNQLSSLFDFFSRKRCPLTSTARSACTYSREHALDTRIASRGNGRRATIGTR